MPSTHQRSPQVYTYLDNPLVQTFFVARPRIRNASPVPCTYSKHRNVTQTEKQQRSVIPPATKPRIPRCTSIKQNTKLPWVGSIGPQQTSRDPCSKRSRVRFFRCLLSSGVRSALHVEYDLLHCYFVARSSTTPTNECKILL